MAMWNGFVEGSELSTTLEEFVKAVMRQAPGMPQIEIGHFSGNAEDVQLTGDSVYLRLIITRHIDASGTPIDIWARLAAPGGQWIIPRSETEMLVVYAAGTDLVAGGAWAFHSVRTPPTNLQADGTVCATKLDDQTTLAESMGGWAMLTKIGSYISINKTDGKIQIGGKDGTCLMLDPTAHSISFVISNGDGTTPGVPCTLFTLDPTGVSLAVTNGNTPSPQNMQTVKWDNAGQVVAVGQGNCYLLYKGGWLGVPLSPTETVLKGVTGPSAIPSINWLIS